VRPYLSNKFAVIIIEITAKLDKILLKNGIK